MTKLFTSAEIREIDAYTINNEPISSIDLMERASSMLLKWIKDNFSRELPYFLFAGPGNNGGDALALARLLYSDGFSSIKIYLLHPSASISADTAANKQKLIESKGIPITEIKAKSDFPIIPESAIIIDGLFGSGLSRPLDGIAADLVAWLNKSGQTIISIDIPSGLFGENNASNDNLHIIKATYTLSFQFPKLCFFFTECDDFLGKWITLPIGLHTGIINKKYTPYNYITKEDIVERLKKRKKFSNKGNYGHALLIAGSYGMMGAAVLSARGALRSGIGLLTTHIPQNGADIIQAAVPESLVSIDSSDTNFTSYPELEKFNAIGIGPGIAKETITKKAMLEMFGKVKVPVVIDADGLNLLALTENWQEKLPEYSILTPHPKEFERLFGKFTDSYSRLQAQLDFSLSKKSVVVLKGAHTCITTPEGMVWFNTTGNPGMAKGGSGDVLTGMILGLISQGYSIEDAAIVAVYIHGSAGDIAAYKIGQYAMIPSDIINYIGEAFKAISTN